MMGRQLQVSKKLLLLLQLVVQLLLLARPATAWWDTGHMLTAAIARQRLSPAAAAAGERLIAASAAVQASSPVPSTSMVSASHWPDDLKRRDWPASQKVMRSPAGLFVAFDAPQFNSMHYVDFPFEDGGPCAAGVIDARVNILTALTTHRATISNGAADEWTRGVALRYLLHLVGDLHQPLHTAARCTASRPGGDDGGNAFWLGASIRAGNVTNLHSMWDSMGGGSECNTTQNLSHWLSLCLAVRPWVVFLRGVRRHNRGRACVRRQPVVPLRPDQRLRRDRAAAVGGGRGRGCPAARPVRRRGRPQRGRRDLVRGRSRAGGATGAAGRRWRWRGGAVLGLGSVRTLEFTVRPQIPCCASSGGPHRP
jgi:hypothetical protein